MKIDWNNLPPAGGMRPGSSRKGICGDLISAVMVDVAPETLFDGKTHWHEHEQLLIVIRGNALIVIDGKRIEAAEGEMVFFPSGSRHAVIGTGAEGCTYYEIFAPARPDQLAGWTGSSPLRFD
ncbi:cupin domain-containing protein (plasmid) [Paracoccus sp. TD-10]|uniref:cupin domain-containing protein n=1 Tax=Paracoccus sp. TD-10 TaxID=3395918 RepID=UPI003AB01C3E